MVSVRHDKQQLPLSRVWRLTAGSTSPFGIEGWRFAFLSVALVSIAIGVGNFMLAHDPRFPPGQDKVLYFELLCRLWCMAASSRQLDLQESVCDHALTDRMSCAPADAGLISKPLCRYWRPV